jgi:hypothetical protein
MQYPIVSSHHLGAPVRRYLRKVRSDSEIPTISSNQVLVYRVGAKHTLDNIRLPMDHDTVVSANFAAVVDTSLNVPVDVDVNIPSADAADFIARVRFACHVLDPITVVQDGISDASVALVNYLRTDRALFELGLEFGLDQVNDVRPLVSSTVQAMTMLEPPDIPGLEVRLIGVEVSTPTQVAEFHGVQRGVFFENAIARVRQDGRHDLETHDKVHEQQMGDRDWEGHKRRTADLEKVIGTSPEAARRLGITLGQETTTGYAQSLEAAKERNRVYELNTIHAQREILEKLEKIGLFQNLTVDENALLQNVLERAGIDAPILMPAGSDARLETTPTAALDSPLLIDGGEDDD